MAQGRYIFGKDFKLSWFYDYQAIPSSDAPDIYIFSDAVDLSVAKAGTGSIQNITSWTDGTEPFEKVISVTAIADPVPNGSDLYKDYYVAINYTIKASGQEQTNIHVLRVRRGMASLQPINITVDHLRQVFPLLLTYVTEETADEFLKLGLAQVRSDLAKIDVDWDTVTNKDDFKLALAFKCISEFAGSEYTSVGDKWHTRYTDFQTRYSDQLDSLKAKTDTTQDGEEDGQIEVSNWFTVNRR